MSANISRALALGAGTVLAAACRASAPEGEADQAVASPVSVVLATSYRGRWGEGRDDHDLTEVAILDVGDRSADAWTFHALAQASADLDGNPDSGDGFAFYSLADTYDGRVTGRLHHAYAEAHELAGLALFRAGRQLVYDTPETLHFDGVRVEGEPRGERAWRVGGYGGVPTLPYESSRAGDYVAGVFAEMAPTRKTTLRADWMHVRDGDQLGDDTDDLVQIAGRWRPSPRVTLEASHSRLVEDPRDVELGARVFDPEADLAFEASWYELLETQKELAVPLDPFFATLFEYHPYRQAGLTVSKGLGGAWFVQAGAEARRVSDSDDVGPTNRDWSRWFATTSSDELLPAGVSVAVTAEVWDGEGDRYETWGLDLSRELPELGEGWNVAAGSYYSLFKWSYYLGEEQEDVRTWYAGLRRRMSERLSWRVRYELEENDLDDFHTLRVGMTWEL